jgi:hypothetical protein
MTTFYREMTARVEHRCEYADCAQPVIRPGERYVLWSVTPGDMDDGGNDDSWAHAALHKQCLEEIERRN